jgi:hypothetical protein
MTDRLANAQERAIKMMEKVFIECYREGFDDGYKDGSIIEQSNAVTTKEEVAKMEYERGLNDTWECIKKLYTMYTKGDITKIFNASFGSILKNYSAQECIAKIKKYEEKEQKIKVGDIVTVVGDIVIIGEKPNEFIVTWVGDDEVTLITRNGFHARTARIDSLIKTGEHCDIEKCFKCTVF